MRSFCLVVGEGYRREKNRHTQKTGRAVPVPSTDALNPPMPPPLLYPRLEGCLRRAGGMNNVELSKSVKTLGSFFDMKAKDVYADAHMTETIKDAIHAVTDFEDEAQTRGEVSNERGYIMYSFEPHYDPNIVERCEELGYEQLEAFEGERLTCHIQYEDEWWLVEMDSGEIGLVPGSYCDVFGPEGDPYADNAGALAAAAAFAGGVGGGGSGDDDDDDDDDDGDGGGEEKDD